MEEGSLRCDANVSLRPRGRETLGTRAEIKNLNSFRNVARAIDHEVARQAAVIGAGGTVVQETRLWDADRGETVSMRSKEEAHDYRYFPEPDLPPLLVGEAWIEEVRRQLPARTLLARREEYVARHGLIPQVAQTLTGSHLLADYFEATAAAAGDPKGAANWTTTEVLRKMNEQKIDA